jgi:hypothetical protein
MAHQATLIYQITALYQSVAALATKVAAVPLQTDVLEKYGVTLASDATTTGGTVVTRTLVFDLLPQFDASKFAPINPQTSAFKGYVVSSSAADLEGGGGMSRLQVLYKDPAGVPKTNNVVMAGAMQVPLISRDHMEITSLVPQSGSPSGLIGLYSDANELVAKINANFQGSIFSTSENDKAGGIGAQGVTITYADAGGGGPHTETIALNGNTPVNFTNTNHAVITDMVPTPLGTANGNLGIISLMSGLNGGGGLMGRLEPSFYVYFPQDGSGATDQKAPFRDLFTYVLGGLLATKVTALTPVIT